MNPEQKKDVTHYIVLNVLVIAALCFVIQDEALDMGRRAILVVVLAVSNALMALSNLTYDPLHRFRLLRR